LKELSNNMSFIGEFECKLDPKGRLMLPVALRKQIPEESYDQFVLNRGFEKHLNLYPTIEWKRTTDKLSKLNLFVKKNRDFLRRFNNGAIEVQADNSGRVLITKSLLEYASIGNEVVLVAYSNRIEIWDKQHYQSMIDDDSIDFSDLAEEVMGELMDSSNLGTHE
jgi:MraZ protein